MAADYRPWQTYRVGFAYDDDDATPYTTRAPSAADAVAEALAEHPDAEVSSVQIGDWREVAKGHDTRRWWRDVPRKLWGTDAQ